MNSALRDHDVSASLALERRVRMLRTAMGPDIAKALNDPDVVEVMLNPDGSLSASVNVRPSISFVPTVSKYPGRTIWKSTAWYFELSASASARPQRIVLKSPVSGWVMFPEGKSPEGFAGKDRMMASVSATQVPGVCSVRISLI